MFGDSAICWIRQCGIDAVRSAPRTSRVTDLAPLDRYIAACPAELAPPTMYTSWPWQAAASVSADP
jgi:hypothetical protein